MAAMDTSEPQTTNPNAHLERLFPVPGEGYTWGPPEEPTYPIPEWDAAKPGFEPLLAEGATIALKAGGCCMNPFSAKSALDAEWTPKANEYLTQKGFAPIDWAAL